ncbi:MAG: beta-mannanase [Acidobacteria bacterium]|nr:beta-mannanase [Acidobacteriota bacterium]
MKRRKKTVEEGAGSLTVNLSPGIYRVAFGNVTGYTITDPTTGVRSARIRAGKATEVVATYAAVGAALIYHGVATHSWSSFVTPGSGQADAIRAEVDAYEAAAGRTVAWVEFGHEWENDGRAFPTRVAASIRNRGATPLIFLNLRSVDLGPDPVYPLAKIISGKYDSDLAAWADEARNFGSELIVIWGWEMNGDWAPWNGYYNGGEKEGPKRFKEAYRHIIELMKRRGATNIRWGFHINFPEYPSEPWNAFENYYPGDDVIDCTGVSIYGAQAPTEPSLPSFVSNMDAAYARLMRMVPGKPVFVFELATTPTHSGGDQVAWAEEALAGILTGRWPAVRGFAWWNDYWENDSDPANDTEMRVEAVPELASAFKAWLSSGQLGDRPPVLSFPAQTTTPPRPARTAPSRSGSLGAPCRRES